LTVELTLNVAIGLALLVLLYAAIIREVAHRTVIALFFAAIVVALNFFLRYTEFGNFITAIDLDTILLLMCMMILVGIMSRTGVFSYIAAKIVEKTHASPFILVMVLSGITALISAFIDNVTTVLILSPIVIEAARKIRIDPRPPLLAIVFASNIGGTATLIGDPPNILIGSAADLGFMDFIYNLGPAVLLSYAVFAGLVWLMFSRMLRRPEEVEISFKGEYTINRSLLVKVLSVLAAVVVLFTLEDLLHYPPAIPPLIGSGILLFLVRNELTIEDALRSVDWTTLVFFMGMFIVIKGIEELGVMNFIAQGLLATGGGLDVLMLLIVWVSAIVSAFVDNIPFVMSMIPVIASIASMSHIDPAPLYWSLSLGGCFGGNGTLVGASANVVVAGIAERYGVPLSFTEFMKYGMMVTIATVSVASAYLILRYGII